MMFLLGMLAYRAFIKPEHGYNGDRRKAMG